MTSSPFVRRMVFCFGLALGVPGVVLGQTNYAASGGEYSITGPLIGDQAHPSLGLNASGGYLVWEDNATDGRGLGISALALDNNFSAVGKPFRVNQIGAGDQELSHSVLLNNGGTAFVWQGGRRGFQHIFARFLSPSNTWVAGDVEVNTFTNHAQINPSMALLSSGNLIVVWGSFNQAGPTSMQDVYGQILSPSGQKVGSEFLINQFTAFNQRTPAVAALSGGGFVVVWVSEQQRTLAGTPGALLSVTDLSFPSVDVFARLFGPDASPLGDEFLVNTGSDVCANPCVAAGSDGGFMVAWGQRKGSLAVTNPVSQDVTFQFSTDSWDIFARSFSSTALGGSVQRANTYTYGDQYIPEISVAGTNYLAVWTSLGQDGSKEGVYGQFLNGDGSASGGEFRVNTTTQGPQMQPGVASAGMNRFLAVWTSLASFINGLDLYAQLYAGPGYSSGPSIVTYRPPPNDPFPDPSLIPAPAFPVADPKFASAVITNALASAQGAYNGLFYDTNGVTASSAGYFTATVTSKGAYSGRLTLAGRTYSLHGHFNSAGWATNTIGSGSGALTVVLQLDLSGGNEIQGQITGANWSAFVQADHQALRNASSSAAFSGNYTLVIPPANLGPQGNGAGSVRVDASGNVRWSGTLADGARVSQSSAVSETGFWPLYASLYGAKGAVISWIQFSTNGSIGGNLIWVKPAGVMPQSFPGGFTNDVEATGSLYTPPAPGSRLQGWEAGTGSLIFSDGGLLEPFTNLVTLDLHNKATSSPGNKLTLNINTSSGLFNGTALNPETGARLPFSGSLWEDGGEGLGFFLNGSQSGAVQLEP